MKIKFPGQVKPCSVGFRRWLFYRVWIATGRYREGGKVPYWLYPLWFIGTPMRFIRGLLGCTHHVPGCVALRIGNHIYSGAFLALLDQETPGPWIRAVRGENGMIVWEHQTNEVS